jgi:hypothetical protein
LVPERPPAPATPSSRPLLLLLLLQLLQLRFLSPPLLHPCHLLLLLVCPQLLHSRVGRAQKLLLRRTQLGVTRLLVLLLLLLLLLLIPTRDTAL